MLEEEEEENTQQQISVTQEKEAYKGDIPSKASGDMGHWLLRGIVVVVVGSKSQLDILIVGIVSIIGGRMVGIGEWFLGREVRIRRGEILGYRRKAASVP